MPFYDVTNTLFGHILSKDGVSTDPSKIELVQKYPKPLNVKEVRQFLGFVGFYRRFIRNFSQLGAPLYNLLKNNQKFIWDESCQKSFDELKQRLVTAPVLDYPSVQKDSIIYCDASNHAVGYIYAQRDEHGVEKPVFYGGRTLRPNEKNWTIGEKECLALVLAITENHHL